MLKTLPEYINVLISAIEKVGRTEEDNESNPVKGFLGVFYRGAAGSAKSADGKFKVAYGISHDELQDGDKTLVPLTGSQTVYFLGTKEVTTLDDVTARFKAFIAYAKKNLGMNEATASVTVIERFNHAFNIQQRTAFRPSPSGATGSKAVTDIMRAGIKAGIDPKLLEQKAAEIVAELAKGLAKTA